MEVPRSVIALTAAVTLASCGGGNEGTPTRGELIDEALEEVSDILPGEDKVSKGKRIFRYVSNYNYHGVTQKCLKKGTRVTETTVVKHEYSWGPYANGTVKELESDFCLDGTVTESDVKKLKKRTSCREKA